MVVVVHIPGPLREYTRGESDVEVDAKSVREVIDALNAKFPGIKERICDEHGDVRRFVNIFVNDENVMQGKGINTEVRDRDEVYVLPSIAGGGEW